MVTLTPPPITMTRAELDASIRHFDRAAERADALGFWLDAEEYRDAADTCRDELAARDAARDAEAVARHIDAYDLTPEDRADILANIWERR